ncbi:MAG: alpha-hydroxy-acid oxidizing protein [Candidatus Muirbacterium halophilum]|nr:alpha-hydroxy-acid oxidizing protein [Candidatus Muirbacterium halophilum]
MINNVNKIFNEKCFNCPICDGVLCAGILPGMGGFGNGKTFQNNYNSWEEIEVDIKGVDYPLIGIAPMTGATENMGGFLSERQFQHYLVIGSQVNGVFYCAGDGNPDFKLHYGLEAIEKYGGKKSGIFLKPYVFEELKRRIGFFSNKIKFFGIDIDSATLVNLKGKVKLEEKGWEELLTIKKLTKIPFVIKGIYSTKQFEIVQKVRPYAIVISNHGGRIFDNGKGTAYLLKEFESQLRPYVNEIWVDGGLRTENHIKKAKALGADRVLIGRPIAVSTILNKENGVDKFFEKAGICI